MNHKKNTSFLELSKLIIEAIEQDQFFNKEILIPKVKAILSGFQVNISTANYNKIETPSESAKRLRTLEIKDAEQIFWKNKVRDLVGTEKLNDYFKERDAEFVKKGFI